MFGGGTYVVTPRKRTLSQRTNALLRDVGRRSFRGPRGGNQDTALLSVKQNEYHAGNQKQGTGN